MVDRGVSFDRAQVVLEALGRDQEMDGFYQSRTQMFGQTRVLLAIRKRVGARGFLVYRPNTGANVGGMDIGDLIKNYRKVEPDRMRAIWDSQVRVRLCVCVCVWDSHRLFVSATAPWAQHYVCTLIASRPALSCYIVSIGRIALSLFSHCKRHGIAATKMLKSHPH